MSKNHTEAAPVPGETVETVYGRQRVTAVIEMPLLEPTVYLQSVDGGQEWSVSVAQFSNLLVVADGE
ncbi:hypothetical protein ACPA54_37095 [Uniformispora flossi]|uniref:hypothetical protein n=1 Tax=Uniformispora flossi TaxID=3390723 RepID=UPI003C2D5925